MTAPSAAPAPSAPAATRSDRLRWLGGDWFVSGVNIAWLTWPWEAGHGDFGGGAVDGVVSRHDELAAAFAQVQAAGVHLIRWWTFEQNAWPVTRDSNGRPTSLNPVVYADFDAAVALADQYDLYIDFVLFGSGDDYPASWRTDPAQRTQIGVVLGPLFARYKDNPQVLAWEIFNEPEWKIWNAPVVRADDVKAMASAVIASIRANAPNTLVTVGSALVDGYNSSQPGMSMWADVDLDFDSPHWYDQHTSPTSICALCTTAGELRTRHSMSRPIIIGEFEENHGTTDFNVAHLEQWYAKGYAGAWGWSLFPQYTGDGFTTDLAAWATFTARHPDIGPRALAP